MAMPLWLQMFFLFGFPAAFFITIALWAIDHIWLTPQESKAIKKAKRKKKPVVPVAFDNGQVEFKVVKEIGDEGYIKTEDGWIGFLPRPIASNPHTNATKTNPILSRVFFLKDAKVPFLIGYSGKAIITNPKVLAILQYAKTQNQKLKIKIPFLVGAKIAEVDIFWPVNLRLIKSMFAKSWNQAQVRASEVKSELVGMMKGKKYFGMEGMKMFVLPGMIIMAIMIIFALIMIFLG